MRGNRIHAWSKDLASRFKSESLNYIINMNYSEHSTRSVFGHVFRKSFYKFFYDYNIINFCLIFIKESSKAALFICKNIIISM